MLSGDAGMKSRPLDTWGVLPFLPLSCLAHFFCIANFVLI